MKLYSWGANSYGQLGLGKVSNECVVPTEVDASQLDFALEDITSISAGGGHTFLVHRDGRVFGCGWNHFGQLSSKENEVTTFTLLNNLERYKISRISSKWDTSFALTFNNYCIGWGSNAFGQLGRLPANMLNSKTPVELVPIRSLQVEAGLRHCAIVTEEGYILTAGDSRKGQLGRRPGLMASTFLPVPGVNRVRSVACGQLHTLAITEDNKLFGWGCNKHGQLGVDPTLHQVVHTPLEILLPPSAIDKDTIIMSGWTHSALLTGNGQIINWGRNIYGQLGSPSYQRHIEWKPEPLNHINKVRQLHLGSEHNLAILDDDVLVSWGWNEHGNCGVGYCSDVTKPECVKVNSKAVTAGVGAGHSIAIVVGQGDK